MPKTVTVDADDFAALMSKMNMVANKLKDLDQENKRLHREAETRTRSDADAQQNWQRQHSLSISQEIEDRHKGRTIQEEYDQIYQHHGRQAPPQREGETSDGYERRLASSLQFASPEWKDVNLLTERDPVVVRNAIKYIKADAMKPEAVAIDVPAGVIREIKTRDKVTGRPQTEFVSSDPNLTFIHQMGRAIQRTAKAGMKFIDPVAAMAGVYRPTVPSDNVPEGMRPARSGPMPLRQGLPR